MEGPIQRGRAESAASKSGRSSGAAPDISPAPTEAVRLPYRDIVKPGVRFRREVITAIDPVARRVTTEAGGYDADLLVVALGADYDLNATPGLAEGGNEFYSLAGAERLREVIPA